MIQLHAVFVGQPQTMTDEQGSWQSAIFRRPVDGPIELELRGLVGDQVADAKNHGSPDQAVCCEPLDHYAYWNNFYGRDSFGPGSVGENWTISGATEQEICSGDVVRVGTARIQVASPRYPCTKQDRKLKVPGFQQQTVASLRTGFYVRVLTPGIVQAGDEWLLEERPHPILTLHRLNQHIHHNFDSTFARELLEVAEVGNYWTRILKIFLRKEREIADEG